ncbi:hypothetical protein, partial [uncultured Methylobacterium sp.]|uniref:hypothetical protein n=1 Tax=uncultured Methylobacterium sp. TaxID=157278 RepID=UPI0025954CDA
MKEVMRGLAPFIANDWTILLVVLSLLLWAGWCGLKLWKGTGRLTAALDGATRRIERTPDAASFAAEYEVVSADLGRDPILGGRWEEFDDSLVRTATGGGRVRSTGRCDLWFNLGLLRAVGVDPRFHAALPNLLVGAGLLFTFLGLAAALTSAGGVMEGSPEARNGALKTLLDAASAKFVTSLAGLALSILYALLRKARLARVETALDRFATALEKRAPLVTPVALQQEAIALLDRQATYAEALATDLSLAIAQSLDQAFDKRLGEHVQPLTEAMQRLADGLSSRNEDAVTRMLDGFLERLQGGTGDRMEGVAASLERLGERLDGLQSGLGEAASRMAQSADTMAARMGEGAEAALSRITDQMGSLAETLRAVADETRGAGAEAGRELAARLVAAAAGFEAAARSMTEALVGAAEQSESRMGRQAEESAARLAAQVEAMVGELRALAEGSRNAG